MKTFGRLFLFVCLISFVGCTVAPPLSLHWEFGQNDVEPGVCEAYLTITNTSNQPLTAEGWILYFNFMSLHPLYAEGDALKEREIQASWHSITPTAEFEPIAPGESKTFVMRYRGNAIRQSSHPEGFFIVYGEEAGSAKPISVPCTYAPYTRSEQMKRGVPTWEKTPYADGEYVYEYVERVSARNDTPLYVVPVLPQPRHCWLKEGVCDVSNATIMEDVEADLPSEGYFMRL